MEIKKPIEPFIKDKDPETKKEKKVVKAEKKKNEYVVNATLLNIRQEPNTEAEVLGTYKAGEVVECLNTEGVWIKTDRGWCMSAYLIKK